MRVEGINAIVHGADEDDVMRSLAGDRQPGHVKRLRENMAIDGQCEDFAEAVAADGYRRQNCFVRV